MIRRYRLTCTKILNSGEKRFLCEAHVTLTSALEGMQDHQQRPWQSVCLTPVDLQTPPRYQSIQLDLMLEEGLGERLAVTRRHSSSVASSS